MTDRREIWFAAAAIGVAAVLAYSNSFGGPFVFDDVASILTNASIKQLWPLSGPLTPPHDFGSTVSGRPLLNLSLAFNYALSGESVGSYHAVNLIIHTLAGLVLFGVIRRTLRLPSFSGDVQTRALPAALIVALLWTLHPLQTESVTYVIQRAESLMGLFFLLTLYAFVRSRTSAHPARWQTASVVACAAGMACKEVMVVAPVVVALYDWTFVGPDLPRMRRERRGFYVALAATWLVLLVLVLNNGGNRGGTFAFDWVAFEEFLPTQFEAIAHYLRLVIWPVPLVFEYGRFRVDGLLAVAPYVALVGGLALAAGAALVRRRPAGFLGISFFLVLAPTSLIPGVTQTMAEHRMYLPLAAVLACLATGAVLRWGRFAVAVGLILAVAAGVGTWRRNEVYRTALSLWTDTAAKRPSSALAQSNLGSVYFKQGDLAKARACYVEALRLNPESAHDHYNLGLTLDGLGETEEAMAEYQEAVRILPYYAPALVKRGAALIRNGRPRDAIEPLTDAIRWMVDPTEAYLALGTARSAVGENEEAAKAFAAAQSRTPHSAAAEAGWAVALLRRGDPAAGLPHAERALRLRPDAAETHYTMGLLQSAMGRVENAMQHYRETIRREPSHADAQLNLGILLAQAGQLAEAKTHVAEAVRLQPGLPEARANLGIVLAESGEVAEALKEYETALRLRPDYPIVHYNLANVLLRLERWAEADAHLREAIRLKPDFTAAQKLFDQLSSAIKQSERR